MGTPPTLLPPAKPVSTMVPSGESMVTLVVDSACSCASVTGVPPIVMLLRPSGADRSRVPVVRSAVSGPPMPSTRPRSSTEISPAAPGPLPSTGVIAGTPSVWPLTVSVSVAVLVSPSPSVIV